MRAAWGGDETSLMIGGLVPGAAGRGIQAASPGIAPVGGS
jgi:hypothetical protein